MNGLFYLFIFSCRCRRFGRQTPLHSNRFLMVCFPFLSFSISGHEKLAEENRNRTSASSVRLRRRGKERKQITTRKRQEWWKRGKRARFASGLYIVLCVCVLHCPSTWLPESAVYLGWVWCLHAWVCVFLLCVLVRLCLCLFFCVCVPGVEPQPPGEEQPSRLSHLLHPQLLYCLYLPIFSLFSVNFFICQRGTH